MPVLRSIEKSGETWMSKEPADFIRHEYGHRQTLAKVALLAHGIVLDHEEPAMAVPLEEDEEELIGRYEQAVTRVGEGFDVAPVEDGNAETLADWMTAWGSGMRSIEVMESWKAVYMVMLRELPRSEFSMFVGRVYGRAVGTGIMYRAEGVAAVHYITTLPEFRKRGIGTALTLHAMVLARRFGCRIAMLTASQIRIVKLKGKDGDFMSIEDEGASEKACPPEHWRSYDPQKRQEGYKGC
ncbi:hypothetical protein OIDMADRAFT_35059 [Oidiodendron maius Zn]|uniref:N-acetyltransferase domain-containing protein n=1 Tax=Oidiodendron maius (strain Zn) TaxID=913774 RepID=A0A0C3CXW3_OIDMZ|nr:hypothetical protein OIDMADRAFT_35059 [Oidiodendron maius Zn]